MQQVEMIIEEYFETREFKMALGRIGPLLANICHC